MKITIYEILITMLGDSDLTPYRKCLTTDKRWAEIVFDDLIDRYTQINNTLKEVKLVVYDNRGNEKKNHAYLCSANNKTDFGWVTFNTNSKKSGKKRVI